MLPTLYTQNGVDIVFQPAPFGLQGLVKHEDIGFAWDPASNREMWTVKGNLDAWPPEFYEDFDYRILGHLSFNQALCVFTEGGVHRADGNDPTTLQWNKTKAAPCRAGGSIQVLRNRVLYLGDEGLLSFDGQESTCLTDLKIPGEFWLANSAYLFGSDPQSYLVPPWQNAAYERLRGADLGSVTPRDLTPYLDDPTSQRQGLRSFIKYGRYYLYWGGDYPAFAAQTMLCIDFAAPGAPITIIGIKPIDAFVDEAERVHLLLQSPSVIGPWHLAVNVREFGAYNTDLLGVRPYMTGTTINTGGA